MVCITRCLLPSADSAAITEDFFGFISSNLMRIFSALEFLNLLFCIAVALGRHTKIRTKNRTEPSAFFDFFISGCEKFATKVTALFGSKAFFHRFGRTRPRAVIQFISLIGLVRNDLSALFAGLGSLDFTSIGNAFSGTKLLGFVAGLKFFPAMITGFESPQPSVDITAFYRTGNVILRWICFKLSSAYRTSFCNHNCIIPDMRDVVNVSGV